MNKLDYAVPIKIFESFEENEFIIQGIAINATVTDNNHKFLAEELRKSAESLSNRPLLVDHDDSIRSIIGRVIASEFDELGNAIKFKARLNDTEQGKLAKQLIKAGDLNTVSIGASIESFEEEGDMMIPIGIKFKELSLVATPADDGAQFTLIQSLNNVLKESKAKQSGEPFPKSTGGLIFTSGTITDTSQSIEQSKDKLNLNRRKKIMEKDKILTESEETPEETTEEAKTEGEESKVDENTKDIYTLKSSMSEISKQLKAQSNLLGEALAELKKVKEADADEEPKAEEPKEESKEEAPKEEPAEEAKEEETSEDAEDEGEEEETETVGEGYKIVQGYKSFTVERKTY